MSDSEIEIIKAWLGTGAINLFGRPFAGKDTQGNLLAETFNGRLIGGGDILRNSTIPAHVQAELAKGNLIPSQDYVDIVLPYLTKNEFSASPLILSSVGRWLGEEQGVIAATNAANHHLKAVIYLELEEEVVLQRWQALEHHNTRAGRYDDTEDVLKNRLNEFREKTLPVIEAYEQLGLLIRIDGMQAPDAVYDNILEKLFVSAQSQA